ncbi:hypothetical protein GP486_005033 [Trichoglossum hirsutum]|uniref:Uncharacterized protein n=1 Tax=Trichoglossum hirsutum TaxID=265104 RepID=A0A9P8L9V8_9PEZI|nr:hypothetical protein GP486_005033 [Trichoglossum hirsutum]
MAFATKLFEAEKSGAIAKSIVLRIFRDVLADVTPELTLGFDAETTKRQKTDLTLSAMGIPPVISIPLVRKINGQSIADLVGQCISLGLGEEVSHILEKLTIESQTAYPSAFETVLLPFLKQLLIVLQQNQIPLSTACYQCFAQHLIATYLMRHVRAEPRDWVRPRYGCGCDDCGQLDKFLADPNFGLVSFSTAKKRRDHIKSRVPCRGFSIQTVKTSLPHALVITKTEDEGCKSMTRWKQRCEDAKKQISELGTEEQLVQALGSRYEELTTLRLVKLPVTATAWTVAPGRRVRFSGS